MHPSRVKPAFVSARSLVSTRPVHAPQRLLLARFSRNRDYRAGTNKVYKFPFFRDQGLHYTKGRFATSRRIALPATRAYTRAGCRAPVRRASLALTRRQGVLRCTAHRKRAQRAISRRRVPREPDGHPLLITVQPHRVLLATLCQQQRHHVCSGVPELHLDNRRPVFTKRLRYPRIAAVTVLATIRYAVSPSPLSRRIVPL